MFETRCVITEALKQRFCKDMNINIKIFEEPYFTNFLMLYDKHFHIVDKYKEFIALVDEVGGEANYFEMYDKLKDDAIVYLNENPIMKYFAQEEDMSKFTRIYMNFPKTDIFKDFNSGEAFLSIDLRKGNFTALRHYNPEIVGCKDTYEDFLGMFTDKEYFKKSKYIRQVIFGNVNPRRQVTYEQWLMDGVLDELLNIVNTKDVVYFSTDEIVVKLDKKYFTSDGELNSGFVEEVNALVDKQCSDGVMVHTEFFRLFKVENTQGFVKCSLTEKGKYDFKCMDYLTMPFVLRAYYDEEVNELDTVFVYEGRKVKLLDVPEIKKVEDM